MGRQRFEQNGNVIVAQGVVKTYPGTTALRGVSAEFPAGAITHISGPSGSGKTTLLNVLSSLASPDAGSVYFGGRDIARCNNKQQNQYRAEVGQVFQRAGLLAGLTVRENIRVKADLSGAVIDETWVSELCGRLGVGGLLDQSAGSLSGGQAQRVALVRAMAHGPEVLFADEPTAALDTQRTKEVHDVLKQAVDETGLSVVMISHDDISRQYADHTVHIVDGSVEQ